MTDVASPSQSLAPPAESSARSAPGGESTEWTGSDAMGAAAPFYETQPNPRATRRMLLVFFYFAPSAEVGALRWISLARFGAERGWAVDVVTLHPRFMGTLDPSRLAQLAPGVRLFGFSGEGPLWFRGLVGAWRRFNGTSGRTGGSGLGGHLDGSDLGHALTAADAPVWRRTLRSHVHFMLGDGLARRATDLGSALARSTRYDVVVSSGPPHAAHSAARAIAASAGVPFVMDMRDPWSDDTAMPEEVRSTAWQRMARAHEDRCVSSAAAVVVTSEAHEELQVRKYPFLRGRVRTVMNGADTDAIPKSRVRSRFLVAFAGMIYLGRDPRVLFRAAARVARDTGATPEQFAVEFMGDDACDGVPLTTIAEEAGLVSHFRSHGFRPRRDALEFLAEAAVLVSLPLRTTMTLPAKLFEYMRFDAWLLALAERGSATEALLRGTGADVVEPDNEARIVEVLRARFDDFRAGRRPVALNRDGRFDRATQSGRMFGLLEEIAATPRGDAARR
jgi:hypothetical protein